MKKNDRTKQIRLKMYGEKRLNILNIDLYTLFVFLYISVAYIDVVFVRPCVRRYVRSFYLFVTVVTDISIDNTGYDIVIYLCISIVTNRTK